MFEITVLYSVVTGLFEDAKEGFELLHSENSVYDAERERYSAEETRVDCVNVIMTYGASTLHSFLCEVRSLSIDAKGVEEISRYLEFYYHSKP